MSFDLFVFAAPERPTVNEALTRYEAFGQETAAAPDGKVAAFYDALTKRYPELAADDEGPFASAIERGANGLVMAISFSRADEVHAFVEALAARHALYVLDPQARAVFAPGDRPRNPPSPKLPQKVGAARFAETVTAPLRALGFELVPRKKDRWRRPGANGVFVELSLNLGTRDARPDVAIGHESVAAAFRAAVGAREPLPSMGLAYLYYGGLIPGRAWEPEDEGDFGYELCHAECIELSTEIFADEIRRFLIPLAESLDSVAAIDAFFFGRRADANARTGWGGAREELSGPAGRFWRWDRGLVYVTAVAACARPAEARTIFDEARSRAARWIERKAAGITAQLQTELTTLEHTLAR